MITKSSIIGITFMGIISGISGQWMGSIIAIILLLSEWGHLLDRVRKDGYIELLEAEIKNLKIINLVQGKDRYSNVMFTTN